ncbi:17116_t:CDS:2 [Dentiscutata heterogama]|uniref:17116_t:CDS:1 n=1 Tax=Dentiscutata heterogama TaxID=1316150 RepID=A0ACA9KE41_9GLOM|nr:17116_t:CDS:2 [Dentiscutata heterogama]
MGRPIIESYPEYYDFIKYCYERVKSTGKGFFHYYQCIPLYNDGYIEETYFNFGLSPIFKKDGSFCALLSIAFETTDTVLEIRRLKSLNNMGDRLNGYACKIMVSTLRENDRDFPFALIYLVDNNKLSSGFQPHTARLVATTFNKCNEYMYDKLLETPETVDLSKNADEDYDEYVGVRWPTTENKNLTFRGHTIIALSEGLNAKRIKHTEKGGVVLKVSLKSQHFTDNVKKIELLVESSDTGFGNVEDDVVRKLNFRILDSNNLGSGITIEHNTPRHRISTSFNNEKSGLSIDNKPINFMQKSENNDYSALESTGQEAIDSLHLQLKSLTISDLSVLKDKLE